MICQTSLLHEENPNKNQSDSDVQLHSSLGLPDHTHYGTFYTMHGDVSNHCLHFKMIFDTKVRMGLQENQLTFRPPLWRLERHGTAGSNPGLK